MKNRQQCAPVGLNVGGGPTGRNRLSSLPIWQFHINPDKPLYTEPENELTSDGVASNPALGIIIATLPGIELGQCVNIIWNLPVAGCMRGALARPVAQRCDMK